MEQQTKYRAEHADLADDRYSAQELERLHVERHAEQVRVIEDWMRFTLVKRAVNWVIDEQLRRVGLL